MALSPSCCRFAHRPELAVYRGLADSEQSCGFKRSTIRSLVCSHDHRSLHLRHRRKGSRLWNLRVTRNAVLASPEHKVKVSLRSTHLRPSAAVIDPELTCDLPPALTASTGLDALTQLIEPYVCVRANPMTDGFCVDGLHRAARSLREAVFDGQNKSAREDMALVSLFGGLALANAGLGAVHGFAGPIGGMFPAPHGAVCAALLPHVMAANIHALRERDPHSHAFSRYHRIATLLTGNPHATADAGVEWVQRLVADLPIPKLGAYGVREEHVGDLVAKAAIASSMKANPIALTPVELAQTLRLAL